MSLGDTIAESRKEQGITLKDLAGSIQKEDGKPITPQYLNDIEHDRRTPTSPEFIDQVARALNLEPELLYYQSGTLPPQLVKESLPKEKVLAAFSAFRRELES